MLVDELKEPDLITKKNLDSLTKLTSSTIRFVGSYVTLHQCAFELLNVEEKFVVACFRLQDSKNALCSCID